MAVAQNSRVGVTQVLVLVSIYQGAILGIPFSEPPTKIPSCPARSLSQTNSKLNRKRFNRASAGGSWHRRTFRGNRLFSLINEKKHQVNQGHRPSTFRAKQPKRTSMVLGPPRCEGKITSQHGHSFMAHLVASSKVCLITSEGRDSGHAKIFPSMALFKMRKESLINPNLQFVGTPKYNKGKPLLSGIWTSISF